MRRWAPPRVRPALEPPLRRSARDGARAAPSRGRALEQPRRRGSVRRAGGRPRRGASARNTGGAARGSAWRRATSPSDSRPPASSRANCPCSPWKHRPTRRRVQSAQVRRRGRTGDLCGSILGGNMRVIRVESSRIGSDRVSRVARGRGGRAIAAIGLGQESCRIRRCERSGGAAIVLRAQRGKALW